MVINREIYSECTRIAKSYYDLLRQRREIEKDILLGSAGPSDGMPRSSTPGNPTAAKAERLMQEKERVDRKIMAIQDALETLPDNAAMQLIRQNLFRKIPMHWVNLPMSIITMKRIRSRFIRQLAKNLGMI